MNSKTLPSGKRVEINLNPYQGLKQANSDSLAENLGVEINLNPYQGLKRLARGK